MDSSGITTVKCQYRCRKERTRFHIVERLLAELPAKFPGDAQAIQMRLNSFV
jgi:hypothetical protein